MIEEIAIRSKVIKMANSKRKYLEIPIFNFPEIKYGDLAEVKVLKIDDTLEIIYKFDLKDLKAKKEKKK